MIIQMSKLQHRRNKQIFAVNIRKAVLDKTNKLHIKRDLFSKFMGIIQIIFIEFNIFK